MFVELFLQLSLPFPFFEKAYRLQKIAHELSQEVPGKGFNEQIWVSSQGGALRSDDWPNRKRDELPLGNEKKDHPGSGSPAIG